MGNFILLREDDSHFVHGKRGSLCLNPIGGAVRNETVVDLPELWHLFTRHFFSALLRTAVLRK
jgi:hypothetical protein